MSSNTGMADSSSSSIHSSSISSNSNPTSLSCLPIGHGYGTDLRHGKVNETPSGYETCNSIGYGIGHGRCFYQTSQRYYDVSIQDEDDDS